MLPRPFLVSVLGLLVPTSFSFQFSHNVGRGTGVTQQRKCKASQWILHSLFDENNLLPQRSWTLPSSEPNGRVLGQENMASAPSTTSSTTTTTTGSMATMISQENKRTLIEELGYRRAHVEKLKYDLAPALVARRVRCPEGGPPDSWYRSQEELDAENTMMRQIQQEETIFPRQPLSQQNPRPMVSQQENIFPRQPLSQPETSYPRRMVSDQENIFPRQTVSQPEPNKNPRQTVQRRWSSKGRIGGF